MAGKAWDLGNKAARDNRKVREVMRKRQKKRRKTD